MTADEIRALDVGENDGLKVQREIAAQLADLNEFLRKANVMTVRAAGMPQGVPLIGGN